MVYVLYYELPIYIYQRYNIYIPAETVYGIYISQLILYCKDCVSDLDFLHRKLLLARKQLSQGFILVKLKSLLRQFYSRHHQFITATQMTTLVIPATISELNVVQVIFTVICYVVFSCCYHMA